MIACGEYNRAAHLLEALNRVQAAFGQPEYVMPSAAGPTDGLVTAPATDPQVTMIGPNLWRVAA
jgi:GT2 family glycosyltransferase